MATGFINATGVTAGNNTSVISVTLAANGKSVDFSHVVSGTAIYVDGVLYEGISGTAPTPQGDSTVTVKENISPAITNGALKGFNTIEGLRDAIRNARDIADDLLELDSVWNTLLTGTTPTVEFELNGQTHVETPYQYLVDQFAAGNITAQNATNADKIDIPNKSTNADFDIVFAGSNATSNAELIRDSASIITANPNSGTVKATTFDGTGGRSAFSTLSLGTTGNGNGYFLSDNVNGRTTFTAGEFYFTNTVTSFINYAPIQYHGATGVVGQSLFRANTLSGDSWSITGSGLFTATGFVGELTGNATSSTQSLVDNNTSSAAAYPVIWSDGRHSGDGNDNLYKSFGGDGVRNLLFNPNEGILSTHDMSADMFSRSSPELGYLHASNSTAGSTNPIFCVDPLFAPNATTLADMYGIGYARGDSAFVTNHGPSTGGWGLYVASGGAARIFLDSTFGNISITGAVYATSGFTGDLTGNADSATTTKVQSGSYTGQYDILWADTDSNANLFRTASNKMQVQPSTGTITAAGGFVGDLSGQATTSLGVYCVVSSSGSWYDMLSNNDTTNVNTISSLRRATGNKLRMQPSTGAINSDGGFIGNLTGNADTATKVSTTTNGSTSYYDILAHGNVGSVQEAYTPTRAASGKLRMRPSDGKIMTSGNIEAGGIIHADDGFTSNGYARLAGAVAGSNHHRGSYGTYVTTDKIHPIWGINTSWKLDSDGLGAGNYYGLSHVHTTGYGGDASTSSGNSWATFVAGRSQSQGVNDCKYAVQWTSNGDCKSLFGEAIWSQGNITTESQLKATGGYEGTILMDDNTADTSYQNMLWTKKTSGDGQGQVYLSDTKIQFRPSDGALRCAGAFAANTPSDRRIKNTVEVIADASTKVSSLSGNTYFYNDSEMEGSLQYGLIAQEVQEIMPEIVNEGEDGVLRIKTGGLELTALLVEAHKEVSAKVDAQAIMIENMMNRLAALESK